MINMRATLMTALILAGISAQAAELYHVSGNWDQTAWTATPGTAANTTWIGGSTAVFTNTISLNVNNSTTGIEIGGLIVSNNATATISGGSRTFSGAALITGNLVINTTGGFIALNTTGGFNGTLTATNGICQVNTDTALSANTHVNVIGTLNLQQTFNSLTIGSLSGSGIVRGNYATSSIHDIYAVQNTNTTFSGDIAWGGASGRLTNLHKQGSGELTLSGTPSCPGGKFYAEGGILRIASTGVITNSGVVTINGGTLLYNNNDIPFNRSLTFTSGALGGTGTISSNITVGAGNRLTPGDSTGTLAFTTNLTFSAGSTNVWQLGALSEATDFDCIQMTGGTAALSAGTLAVDLSLLAEGDRPTASGLQPAYWREDRSWTIVKTTGTGAISGQFASVYTGIDYADGRASFTLTGGSGSNVVLHWNAAPPVGTVISIN